MKKVLVFFVFIFAYQISIGQPKIGNSNLGKYDYISGNIALGFEVSGGLFGKGLNADNLRTYFRDKLSNANIGCMTTYIDVSPFLVLDVRQGEHSSIYVEAVDKHVDVDIVTVTVKMYDMINKKRVLTYLVANSTCILDNKSLSTNIWNLIEKVMDGFIIDWKQAH